MVIQPLSEAQVDHTLARAGKALTSVRTALKLDKTLLELLETPLMLSIVALAFQNRSANELLTTGTQDERRAHLFRTCVKAMLDRHQSRYPERYTRG